MAINYQFDVINPFQAALQGYGAGAQILQQERAAAAEQAQTAQRNQLFGLQMQEAQLRTQQLQKQMTDAEEMKTLYGEYSDIMDQVRETNDPSLLISSGIIDRLAPVNEKMAAYAEGRFQQMTDAAKKVAFQNVMAPAVAGMMGNYEEQKSLLQTQRDAFMNSGKEQEANAIQILIDQLDNPKTRDLVTKTLLGRAIDLDAKATSEQVGTISTTMKLPFEIDKIQAELAAAAAKANGQPDPADRMKAEGDLRGEWNRLNAPYKVMQQAIAQMRTSAEQKSVAGDTALITQFRKLLDPTSVVREAEFAQTAEAGSMFRKLETLLAQQTEGVLIANKARNEIVSLGNQLMAIADAANRRDREPFEATADTYGLNKRLIFGSSIPGEVPKVFPDYANMTLDQLSKVDVMKMDFEELQAWSAANTRALQKAGRGQ